MKLEFDIQKGRFKSGIVILVTLIMVATFFNACGAPAVTQSNNEPVEIVSAIGPVPPINPGGPVVEITAKNVSSESVVSLSIFLELSNPRKIDFDFTSSKPLLPNQSASTKLFVIGPEGFTSGDTYSWRLEGTLQDGTTFDYTKQVRIKEP